VALTKLRRTGIANEARASQAYSLQCRALEIIAAQPDGCTEAFLAAENIPADILFDLVQSGLAMARVKRVDDGDRVLEVTALWITAAGELALAARW
jgi:hypothetical protein